MTSMEKKEYLSKVKSYWPSLCEDKDGHKVSKTGNKYIDAVISILKDKRNKLNQSDYPIREKEIANTHTFDEFLNAFRKGISQFIKVGYFEVETTKYDDNGTPKNNEKITLKITDSQYDDLCNKKEGLAYIFVCKKGKKEFVIKIGETRKTFAERLKSYNCGNLNDIDTASKTNIRILQTIVANSHLKFYVYLLDCSVMQDFSFGDVKSKKYPSSYRIAVQDICLNEYMKAFNNQKPIGNVQAERLDS